MAAIHHLRRAIVLSVLMTAASFTNRLGMAAVPPSVAVRQQSPDVEAIIGQLEAKATNAVGTWTTKSGRQDVPAQEWTTGIGAGGKTAQWYWKSEAQAPAATAGLAFFDDSEDAYVLPYGADATGANAKGGLRFQYDTLRTWQTADYLSGHFLLHMNLLPRQFLGALGGIKVLGEETLPTTEGGDRIVHLRADPRDDHAGMLDPALYRQFSDAEQRSRVFDIYFSPEKRAIVKVTIGHGPNGGTTTSHLELSVTAWDTFGTSDSWPSHVVGKVVQTSPVTNGQAIKKDVGKSVLTSVEHFVTGKDKSIEKFAQNVHDTVFFATPLMEVRDPDFYRQSLKLHENASDRVALAQADFLDALTPDMQEAVQQWQIVDDKIQSSGERHRLNEALAPPANDALYQLSQTFDSKSAENRAAGVTLLKRFSETLNASEFRSVSYGAVMAWERLRRAADTSASVLPLNNNLIPRFATQSNVFVLEKLIEIAEAKHEDASLIDPALKSVLDGPIPPAGLYQSQQDFLIVASVRAMALDRTKSYLASVKWKDSATATQKQTVNKWMDAVAAAQELQLKHEQALKNVIDCYEAFISKPLSDDTTDSVYGKWLLSRVAKKFLFERVESESTKTPVSQLLLDTAKMAGASQFWEDTLQDAAKENVLKPKVVLNELAPLIHICAQTFKSPHFETRLWIDLARDQNLAGKYLSTELQYFNKALAAAPDDVSRGRVIAMIGNAYLHINELTGGADAIEQACDLVNDPKIKNELLSLAASYRSRVSAQSSSPRFPGKGA